VILNQDGIVLSDSSNSWSGHGFSELPYYDHVDFKQIDWNKHNGGWIISHSESNETGWHALVIQPRTEELKQVNKIRWLTIGLVLLILIINIPLSWYISKLFSKPLMQILKSMRELQMGDFEQKVQIELKDEIGQLGNGYNIMVMRIKELIQNVYESELSTKEAELRLLQSQINPHFLYNTLNNISWLLHREGSADMAEMIQKMSDFFRFSLNQGADLITLDKELQIIENYLFLSKIRFGSKLTYSIDTDEQLKSLFIPKLILQPLVENAIVHGIEPMQGQGFVHINIHQHEDEVLFVITDNGMGISPAVLEQLLQGLNAEKTASKTDAIHAFALINVRDRIINQFGRQSRIEITSKESLGTTITVRIALSDAYAAATGLQIEKGDDPDA
jgi:two-component system sensor histidine kinase YesM